MSDPKKVMTFDEMCAAVDAATQGVKERDAEITRLKAWIADLQNGMYVNCVYCGHRYGPGDEVPVAFADALKQHIAVCEKHPMAKLLAALKGEAIKVSEHDGEWLCSLCGTRGEENEPIKHSPDCVIAYAEGRS